MGFISLPFYLCCLAVLAVTAQSTAKERCLTSKQQDIIFVLDSSTSIAAPDFVHQLRFVNSLIDEIDIGPDANQVGVISFSNDYQLNFHLNANSNKAELQAKVLAISRMRGSTFTNKPLEYIKSDMFTPKRGDRLDKENVCVVITEKESADPERTTKAAQALADDGVHMFALGVSPKVEPEELLNIAGSSDRVFQAINFQKLKSLLLDFSENVLGVCPKVQALPGSPVITANRQSPVQKGAMVSLVCASNGTDRDTSVDWYKDNRLIDESFFISDGHVRNELLLRVSRDRELECRVSHPRTNDKVAFYQIKVRKEPERRVIKAPRYALKPKNDAAPFTPHLFV